jgi:hypothetical protein
VANDRAFLGYVPLLEAAHRDQLADAVSKLERVVALGLLRDGLVFPQRSIGLPAAVGAAVVMATRPGHEPIKSRRATTICTSGHPLFRPTNG